MGTVDIRNLDIGMLRTFDALLTERSVSRAASRLFLSQPAVSSSLKRLREVLGDPLFTRSAHGVEPTARALALAPHVQAVLTELGKLLAVGLDFEPAHSDRVFRIMGSDHMSQLILPQLCTELAAAGSGIRIFWESANYPSLAERLQRGDADFGLMPRPAPPAGLWAQVLYEDMYVLVARRGRFEGTVSLQDFCAAPQVFLGYGRSAMEDTIDQIVSRAGQHRHAQVAVTTFGQMAEIVSRTDHVAVFPARVAARYEHTLAVHPLPFELPRYGMYLGASLRSKTDPGMQWLAERIKTLASAA